MEGWFLSALLALVLYGFRGFLPKLAMAHIRPPGALVLEMGGAPLVGLMTLVLIGVKPEVHSKGILFAMLTGVAGMVGTLFFFAAVRDGKVCVVASMTTLYPLVTFLPAGLRLRGPIRKCGTLGTSPYLRTGSQREPVTLKQGAGMVLAAFAIVLFLI